MAAASLNHNHVQPGTSRTNTSKTQRTNRRRSRTRDDSSLHTQIQIDQSDAGSRAGTEVDDESLPLDHFEPETIPIYDIRLFNQNRRNHHRYSASRSLPISLAVTPISELDTTSALSSQWVIISEPRRAESASLSYPSSRQSTNTLNSATHFEDAFSKAGGFYNYQLRVLLVLCLTSLYCGPSMFIWNFLQHIPRHRCRVQSDDQVTDSSSGNTSSSLSRTPFLYPELDKLIPKVSAWSSDISSCQKYDVSISTTTSSAVVPCDQFVFDTTGYSYMVTPVVEYGLVCNKAWLWNVADVIFNVGILVGAVIFGFIADKFGRRPALLLSLFTVTVGGISEVLVANPTAYMVLVGFSGAGIMGTYQTAFVLAMELVGSSQRRSVGFTFYIFFHFGYFISTFYAYFIRDWKLQKAALITPGLIFIAYWWILPESAQWLLMKGRIKEAEDMLTRASHVNKGIEGGSIVFESKAAVAAREMLMLGSAVLVDQQQDRKSSSNSNKNSCVRAKPSPKDKCPDLLGESQPRNTFIVIFVVMLLVGVGPKAGRLYALFKLYDNIYSEYLVNGALEIGGAFVGILLSPFFGRRQLFLVCSVVVSGAFLLMAILTIYDRWELFWIRIILWKIFVSTAISNFRVIASELFPTCARATLLGICALLMGVGEYINVGTRTDSKQKEYIVGKKDPFVFYGFASAAAGLLILLLPEMYNKPMPNTFNDCRDFSRYDRDFPGLIKIMQKIHGAKKNQRVQELLEQRRRESQAASRPKKRPPRKVRQDGGSVLSGKDESTTETSSQRENNTRDDDEEFVATPDRLLRGDTTSSRASLDTLETLGLYSPFVEPLPKDPPTSSSRPRSRQGSRRGSITSTFELLEERKRKQRELGARLADSRVNSKRKRRESESESSVACALEMRDQQTQAMLENASLASLSENDL